MRKKCSLHNTPGNEYVLAVSIFSPQKLISYVICKRKQIHCISNRKKAEHCGFGGRSLYQIRHRKRGPIKNCSCSVSRKEMPQASGFEKMCFHFITMKNQFKGMHETRSPGYISSLYWVLLLWPGSPSWDLRPCLLLSSMRTYGSHLSGCEQH